MPKTIDLYDLLTRDQIEDFIGYPIETIKYQVKK